MPITHTHLHTHTKRTHIKCTHTRICLTTIINAILRKEKNKTMMTATTKSEFARVENNKFLPAKEILAAINKGDSKLALSGISFVRIFLLNLAIFMHLEKGKNVFLMEILN